MDQKIQMIGNWLSRNYSISELSRIYAVSRKTLYKWIARYNRDNYTRVRELSSQPNMLARAADTVRNPILGYRYFN
jgi:putative transposase